MINHRSSQIRGKTTAAGKVTFNREPGARPDTFIVCGHAGVFGIILHSDGQYRQEVDLPVRVHSVFVSSKDLHVVLVPFNFDEGFAGFTLKCHHGVLFLCVGVLQVLSEGNCRLGCNKTFYFKSESLWTKTICMLVVLLGVTGFYLAQEGKRGLTPPQQH